MGCAAAQAETLQNKKQSWALSATSIKARPLWDGLSMCPFDFNQWHCSYDQEQGLCRNAMGSSRNLKNAVVALLAPTPSIIFYLSFLNHYHRVTSAASDGDHSVSLSPLWAWCYYHPLLLANVLFFLNVNVLFWVISHIQSSHWVSEFIKVVCFLSLCQLFSHV